MGTTVDSDRQVLIARSFDATCEQVFDAWTDPRQLVRWYAPEGCSVEFTAMDVREGGRYHSCIHTPGGGACWCVGEYRVVERPNRLVFTMVVADAEGRTLDPVDAGMDPEWPRETIVTVSFEARAGKTLLTLRQTVSESLAMRTGAHPSWLQMLDNLAREVARAGVV